MKNILLNWKLIIFSIVLAFILNLVVGYFIGFLGLSKVDNSRIIIFLFQYLIIFLVGLFLGYVANLNLKNGFVNSFIYGLIFGLISSIFILLNSNLVAYIFSCLLIGVIAGIGGVLGCLFTIRKQT